MIACVEKTAQNADFYQIIDFLTGCSINYSLLVDPDLIGPWLQQFWATASLKVINDVPHIRAKVAGKKILISEATIRADLLFDDENGVDCFPKQVIWDLLRVICYEGEHISNGTPFLMYPSIVPKFSCRITPLTPSMLEVVTALAAEEEHSTSPHSRAASSARDAQGTPTQSAVIFNQGYDTIQGTAAFKGTAAIPKSPNDYTPTDASQTSGGDEGLLDIYALNREVKRLKRQTLSQAKQIIKLKAKLKKLSKFVQPVELCPGKSAQCSIEEDTAHPFFDDIVDKDAAVTPDLERKSDETEEVNIEEKEASNVKSGETEELDLETTQSTARQGTITPRTLNFEDEAGPSSPLRPIQVMESEEQLKAAEVLVAISRPRGLSIPGPIQSQSQPQQPSQATDPKDKGKGILVEEPKKKKLTLQQIRALETTNDEEVARKIQAEWDAEEERKREEDKRSKKTLKRIRKSTCLLAEVRDRSHQESLSVEKQKETIDELRKENLDLYLGYEDGVGVGRCMYWGRFRKVVEGKLLRSVERIIRGAIEPALFWLEFRNIVSFKTKKEWDENYKW
ncbi:hypothetical protein Tco_1383146 [Tanacetum coccineum]